MKIAIEAQRIFRERKHGMDIVAIELIKNLMKIDTKNEYYIFVKPDKDKCLRSTDNFKIIELKGGPYHIWEQYVLPKAVKRYNCDILHCTSNTAPIKVGVPLIILLHDIIYMESKNLLKKSYSNYQKMGSLYRRFIVPIVLKRAKKIVTVSNCEKGRVNKFFNINDDRLITVYNSIGEHFKPISNKDILTEIRNKYILPKKYFLFLGNTDLKKNTERVLKAYSEYVKKEGSEIKLVILDYSKTELMRLLKKIRHRELQEDIHLIGYVSNTDLPAVYNMCTVFLYPSLRESFGLPPLEAMKCGVPVITSNISSMPEIVGDAAQLIDPYKPEEIRQALSEIVSDSKLSANLINKGFDRSSQFSGEVMAKQNLKIYNELLKQ